MTNTAILAASALLQFAYALEYFGRHFKLPTVVLLIVAGLIARQILDSLGLQYRWVDPIVPLIVTIGLIPHRPRRRARPAGAPRAAGAHRHRAGLVAARLPADARSVRVPVTLTSSNLDTAAAMLAAIPFAVISSAVAIPSAAGLSERPREFIVYESSLSDILGVLVFYCVAWRRRLARGIRPRPFWRGAISAIVAVIAAVTLWYFINQIAGHVRFLPLLAGLICLYAVGKELHLSPLIVVLVCGLLINNPHLITWHAKLRSLHTPGYTEDVARVQGAGRRAHVREQEFLLPAAGLLDQRGAADVDRGVAHRHRGHCSDPGLAFRILNAAPASGGRATVWIAPRGLITVLLFLTARDSGQARQFSVRRGDADRARDVRAHRARTSRGRARRCRARGRAALPRDRQHHDLTLSFHPFGRWRSSGAIAIIHGVCPSHPEAPCPTCSIPILLPCATTRPTLRRSMSSKI